MNREQRRHPSNFNGGIHLMPQMQAQAGPPPGQPVFNVGPLMNAVQLVALMAANMLGPAKEAVERATEIVAEAVVQQGRLAKRIKELQESSDGGS